MSDQPKQFRCAIYTRKSTEEGLEQDFNSLHAQREACEAYIKSQRGEGWKLISTAYDDGGISGGTMERPALKRLMADIESGLIDVIVVYKVDRLTRSLMDFSKMVEVFDRKGVSFVAVTQQFNTTTSMGRLTLNVLLSFAQFEREVTGERIRDKFAASKKKGIWMGGVLSRGYRVKDRKLLADPKEVEIVRTIFQLYLESPGVRHVAVALRQRGITSKPRPGKKPCFMNRGAVLHLLTNPIYIGLIQHKGKLYPGEHKGIVDKKLWDAVQEKLKGGVSGKGRTSRRTDTNLLMGKLFDENGRLLTPSHAVKKGKRYRYYETHSDDLHDKRCKGGAGVSWRLPAIEIEQRIDDIVKAMLSDQASIAKAAAATKFDIDEISRLGKYAEQSSLAERLELVERLQLAVNQIAITINTPTEKPLKLSKTIFMTLRRRGVERRIVIEGPGASKAKPDPQILRALSLGTRLWEELNTGADGTALAFAREEGVDNRYIGRALPLAFLAPDIVEALISGQIRIDRTAEDLLRFSPMPICWHEQRRTQGMF